MTFGLRTYQLISWLLHPFVGLILGRRARGSKESSARLTERVAKRLVDRPKGPLLWLHGASIGETQLLLELARRLDALSTHTILITCQTQTASHLIENAMETDSAFRAHKLVHQMAPIDTPIIARRFLNHWRPNAAIFAEGEIWPNLLLGLQKSHIPHVLLNGRMTEKSTLGWLRWKNTAKRLFGGFQILTAADTKTQTALKALSGKNVSCFGNLKSALPAPSVDRDEIDSLRSAIGDRRVLLAASTHTGEEALALDAYMQIDKPTFLIIAPRHPERGDEIDKLLSCTRFAIARRSKGDEVNSATDILLADTIGEMGLWYRLADTVYLGGGHAPGVGGHNPLEALRLGKPVLTGPSLFNFSDLSKDLEGYDGFSIVADATALASAFPQPEISEKLKAKLETDAMGPMTRTLQLIQPLLAEQASA